MPGANCSIFGCSTSRNHVGIALHRIPKKDDEYSCNWREKLIQIITRDRVVDPSLRRQIEKRNLCICELHFSDDKLLRRKFFTDLFQQLEREERRRIFTYCLFESTVIFHL